MPSQKGLWSSYALAGACTLTTAVGVLAARQLPPAPQEDSRAVREELQKTKEERENALRNIHKAVTSRKESEKVIEALQMALKEPMDAPLEKRPEGGEAEMVPWDSLSPKEQEREAYWQQKASHLERVLDNLRQKWPQTMDPTKKLAIQLIEEMRRSAAGHLEWIHADQIRVRTNNQHPPP